MVRRLLVLAVLLSAACSSGSPTAHAPAPVATTSAPTAQLIRPTKAPSEAATHPAAVAVHYVFPIRGCAVSYGRSHHDYPATDMFAAKGCTIVAAVAGRIDEVNTVDRWRGSTNLGNDRGGLSYSLIGVDGVRYYGSHLSLLSVRAGQQVTAGQVIGKVGNSGDARGGATHQHFGISWPTRHRVWWVRRGELYPWPYLDAWKAGGQKSPVAAVAALHKLDGDVPTCHTDC